MIPFSVEVYLRLIERYVGDTWPAAAAAVLLALLATFLCFRPARRGHQIVALLLSAAWLWIGIVYYGRYFTGLNWAAWAAAGLFVAQGLLLAWFGGRLNVARRATSTRRFGLIYIVFALLAYPAIGVLAGMKWISAPIVGLHPEPTILFTMGFLLLSSRLRIWRLMTLPIAAAFISGISAWLMDWPHDTLLLAAGLLAIILAFRSR